MKRHAQNPVGTFWICQDTCCACVACFVEAPNNIKFDEDLGMSYVFKQPETLEEILEVRKAIGYCPVEAVVEDHV